MKRPRRKWAKWACTLAAVVCVGLAVFSGLHKWQRISLANDGETVWLVELDAGLLRVQGIDNGSLFSVSKATISGWDWRAGLLSGRNAYMGEFGVSLASPVLLPPTPAAFLWYPARRRSKPGACGRCGYDRR